MQQPWRDSMIFTTTLHATAVESTDRSTKTDGCELVRRLPVNHPDYRRVTTDRQTTNTTERRVSMSRKLKNHESRADSNPPAGRGLPARALLPVCVGLALLPMQSQAWNS